MAEGQTNAYVTRLLRNDFEPSRKQIVRKLLRRAAARGELPAQLDLELVAGTGGFPTRTQSGSFIRYSPMYCRWLSPHALWPHSMLRCWRGEGGAAWIKLAERCVITMMDSGIALRAVNPEIVRAFTNREARLGVVQNRVTLFSETQTSN